MPKRLVVVGSINLDLVASSRGIPLPGETVSGNTFNTFPGGKGANQAVAAGRLGAPVSMIGRLGNDAFGTQLRASLEAAGVDTKAVEVVPTSSGIALITTAEDGQNAIVVVPGANGELSPRELDKHAALIRRGRESFWRSSKFRWRRSSCWERSRAAKIFPADARSGSCASACTIVARERGLADAQRNRNDDAPAARRDRTAERGRGEGAAQQLLKLGCRNVILKLGERGCAGWRWAAASARWSRRIA